MKKNMPNSTRKYIRREKARIRREVFNIKEEENLISELYQKVLNKTKKIVREKKQSIAPADKRKTKINPSTSLRVNGEGSQAVKTIKQNSKLVK